MINEQAEYQQAMRDPHNWDIDYIREYYRRNWECTVQQLASMTGYSIAELKQILREVNDE